MVVIRVGHSPTMLLGMLLDKTNKFFFAQCPHFGYTDIELSLDFLFNLFFILFFCLFRVLFLLSIFAGHPVFIGFADFSVGCFGIEG